MEICLKCKEPLKDKKFVRYGNGNIRCFSCYKKFKRKCKVILLIFVPFDLLLLIGTLIWIFNH